MGEGQLARHRARLHPGPRRLARDLLGPRAPRRAVELLDVLPRRGLGHRQPLPLHRCGAEGGAEVLPRDPAGRRGAPRCLLRPLHARGGGARGRHRGVPRCDRTRADLGLPQDLRLPRQGRRRPAQGPLTPQLRSRDHDVPPARRGDARAARPALHRELRNRAGHPARLPSGDGERVARRAAAHRLRREVPVRLREAGPGLQVRGRGPDARGDADDDRRLRAARLGRALRHHLRLDDRGRIRARHGVARAEAPLGRAAARRATGAAARAARPQPARARRARSRHGPRRLPRREDGPAGSRPGEAGGAVRLDPAVDRPNRHAERRSDDPVGLSRRGSLVPAHRQRRDER